MPTKPPPLLKDALDAYNVAHKAMMKARRSFVLGKSTQGDLLDAEQATAEAAQVMARAAAVAVEDDVQTKAALARTLVRLQRLRSSHRFHPEADPTKPARCDACGLLVADPDTTCPADRGNW